MKIILNLSFGHSRIGISIVLLTAMALPAVLAESGNELHESNCIKCHAAMTGGDGSTLYKRDDRRVTTSTSLRERVDYCQTGIGLDWDQAQIKSVSDYLNDQYYQFNTDQ